MGVLDSLIGGAGTALLQRTYMLQSKASNAFGVPQPLAVFDAILEENPEYTADVTQHTVESGPEVTDHIQLKNPSLKLKGIISNSPIDLSSSVGNVVSGGASLFTSAQFRSNLLNTGLQQAAGQGGATLLQGASKGGFLGGAADSLARSSLIGALQSKQIVDIVTKRQKYSSMAIQALRFPRDQSTGFALVFELDLIQIRIVSSISTLLPHVSENVATSAAGTTKLGSQVASQVSSKASAAIGNNSILRQGYEGARGLLKGFGIG